MGSLKKYENPISFSFRAEMQEWEEFVDILRIEKTTPTAFFTKKMREHIKENKIITELIQKMRR